MLGSARCERALGPTLAELSLVGNDSLAVDGLGCWGQRCVA